VKLLEACRSGETLIEIQKKGESGWNRARPEEIVSDADSRHDFSARTKDTLARRVGMRCSNPACQKLTSGPQSDPNKALNIGVAAHIAAASTGGPRYASSQSKSERSSIENGIWLCQNCAKLVDSDEARFTVAVLRQWKTAAEGAARHAIETSESTRNPSEDIKREPTSPARKKVNHAQELARSGKTSEALKEMTDALTIARDEKDEEEEVEILLGLALLSSDRRHHGDRQHYFQEAEKRAEKLKAPSAKVIFFRAKAAALKEKRDMTGAEEAYKAALAICATKNDDDKGNLATQASIVRSSFVHFLCSQKRHEEARPILAECEAYARNHSDAEEAELLQAALEAGIHFSLDTKDEDGALTRIADLESAANTMQLANRIGGDLINVANQASHRNMHRAALCAAQAAIRLGHRCDDGKTPSFLAGAFYTKAVVLLKAGHDEKALAEAEAVLGLCNCPEDEVIKQAAHHLIAEVRRTAGDSQSAVDIARQALAMATGRPEEVAFAKSALARALSDNGETEEALTQAIGACELMKDAGVPAVALADVLLQVVSYSSVLGRSTEASEALHTFSSLEGHGQEIADTKEKATQFAEMNRKLRERIIEIATNSAHEPAAKEPKPVSLEEANAQVVRPLLDLWNEIPDFCATSYDYWGRGNFARILRNAQTISSAFNVTIEVRTLDGLKQAIRLWALYADMLLLIWKGPTEDGVVKGVLPPTSEEPGGSGYIAFAGTLLKAKGSERPWCLCLGHASLLPAEVIAFLMKEARPLLEAGRLIVVPATGVGCVHPGHGPLEQLLTESANAVAGLRGSGKSNEVPIGMMPYSPNAPFELLADVVQEQQSNLRKLRRLLTRRTRELAPNEVGIIASKELALEIDDALRDLADQQSAMARKRGVSSTKEPLRGSFCRFHRDGSRLLPRAATLPSPFAPLLTLQNFGYKWSVGSPSSQMRGRYEPGEKSVIGPWLALPTERWLVAVAGESQEGSQGKSE
jgi:tetratricopeptide (TPR) repeat protein